jgi:hypothetical protein
VANSAMVTPAADFMRICLGITHLFLFKIETFLKHRSQAKSSRSYEK